MAEIKIDFSKPLRQVKPLHGVGQPPLSGISFGKFRYLTDAGIPYSRLHDVGGAFASYKWVDVPNIFRDFGADENDPASYDFAFTDLLITALMDAKVEPYFRLGVTIENFATVRSYRIDPPSDYGKWARICEHIIRHYTEGWADGFNYKITYWEIWNEPDSKPDPEESMMWHGTPEQYFEFYDVAAKHLKACFPHLKIGGYAACGVYGIYPEKLASDENRARFIHYLGFFESFLKHIKESGAPLDYFSWHSYDSDVTRIAGYCDYVRAKLDEYGYTDAESSCNEWNTDSGERGSQLHCAKTAATMIVFQNHRVDNAMFYDARLGIGRYSGIFNPETLKPYPAYYAFTAYNRVYSLGEQVDAESDTANLLVLAAKNGNKGAAMIVNISPNPQPLKLTAKAQLNRVLVTGDGLRDTEKPLPDAIEGYGIVTVIYDL